MNKQSQVSRRSFLLGAAAIGTGLTVGLYADRSSGKLQLQNANSVGLEWDPHAFVSIGDDSLVTVFSKHTEMGQGIYTGLATIVAEELDAAWKQMQVKASAADSVVYENLGWGEQATAGSSSIRNSFQQLRQVGAAVRQMLVQAAAETWSVPAEEISIDNGTISHTASNNSALFGELAERAAALDVPSTVTPKPFATYRFKDKDIRRVDILDKTNGSAVFTQDLQLPGMKVAVVARPPRFGSRLASYDDSAARNVPGVADVLRIPTGVAVIADTFWAALKGRDSLEVDWDDSDAFTLSSEEIFRKFQTLAKTDGPVARNDGDADAAMKRASKTMEVDFRFPYLAHATLEPLNQIVKWDGDSCEIWGGTQQQTTDQIDAAEILGIGTDDVTVNTLLAGGGYGRRACSDYAREAVEIAKAFGPKGIPIKMMWTREDDMRAGMYRPLNYHRISAGLDDNGNICAWRHTLVGQSIAALVAPQWIYDGIDGMSVNGADDWLYAIDNVRVESHSPELPVPILWYRGVSGTHTVFAVETFIDALAELAGRDPLQYRLDMLQEEPRMAALASAVADKADWETPLGKSQGRGIAICRLRDSYLAQVAEVSVNDDSSYSVDRVVAGIDCGQVVNPDIVRAQLEGGTGFGLSSMNDAITLRDGYVEQSNFDQYPLLRIQQMPDVETVIMPSDEPPTGVGELATMAAHAAVANALHAVTGKRYYSLPIRNA